MPFHCAATVHDEWEYSQPGAVMRMVPRRWCPVRGCLGVVRRRCRKRCRTNAGFALQSAAPKQPEATLPNLRSLMIAATALATCTLVALVPTLQRASAQVQRVIV